MAGTLPAQFANSLQDFAAVSDKKLKSSADPNKNFATTGKPQNVVLVISSVTDKNPLLLVESYHFII